MMDSKTFNEVLEAQLERSTSMLVKKAEEYATQDRLHNFRAASNLQGISIQEALGGMMVKHTVSVYDMINSSEVFPIEVWNEKITDHINYLLLLRAVVEEEAGVAHETPVNDSKTSDKTSILPVLTPTSDSVLK